MATGVPGNSFPTTVSSGQVMTPQNFADTGASIAGPGAQWIPFDGRFKVSIGTPGNYSFTVGGGGDGAYLTETSATGAPDDVLVCWPQFRQGQVISKVDCRFNQAGANTITFFVRKSVGYSTTGAAPGSGTTIGTATSSSSTGEKIMTITLGSPFTIDTDTTLVLRWQPNNNNDRFYGSRWY